MQYYLDIVPWYVWLVPLPILIGAALWFASPVIIPMWNALPERMKWIIVLVGTVGLAFVIGRSKGNQTARDRQKELNARAERKREDIHADVAKRSDADIDRQLSKWMRD